ncbi:cupin domain-containing protein [Cupriavidus sp. 2TAF22]|uniref:cupin domain-containing protein n=1 Tax=unclassified Cupriavidus TaxID=2640874 RepID=UPI003F8DB7FC
MSIRRIVTSRNQDGKSIFASEDAGSRTVEFKHVAGLSAALLWETPPGATLVGCEDRAAAARSWVPSAGGSTLMLITFPPDATMMSPGFDPVAAGCEYMELLPGLAETFEPQSPGMHTTDSIDYAVLLEGELHLELDDGETKKLAFHDVVIQNGTRHGWRNKSDKPATMLFVLVGAKRP